MDFDSICFEPDSLFETVAGVNDAQFIMGGWVKSAIPELQRRIIERFGVIDPGNAPRAGSPFVWFVDDQIFFEIDPGRSEASRVLIETGARQQVRLARAIAEVVVKTAGSGIGPAQDCFERCFLTGFHFADGGEALLEPKPVVQRKIERIETSAAIDCDGLVLFNAQLHADAFEQGLAQIENAGFQLGFEILGGGLIQDVLGRSHGRQRAGVGQLFAENGHGIGFGSKLAFRLRGQQVRYLAIEPEKDEVIESVELVKGRDATAPVVMAVTVETR